MTKLLLIRCGGMTANGFDGSGPTDCFETLETPFDVVCAGDTDNDDLLFGFLKTHGWVLPIANPPGEGRIVFDPMCAGCAALMLPPETVNELRTRGLLPPAETSAS